MNQQCGHLILFQDRQAAGSHICVEIVHTYEFVHSHTNALIRHICVEIIDTHELFKSQTGAT